MLNRLMTKKILSNLAITALLLLCSFISVFAEDADCFSFPVSNYYLSGWDFKIYVTYDMSGGRYEGYHLGEDAGGPSGTPVYASGNGIIRHTRQRTGYGNLIIIEHRLPGGAALCSIYGHLGPDIQVSVGQKVSRGQLIGYLGNSSENGGYGPHLHFGFRKGFFADTVDYDGGWRYRGYTKHEDITNEWYKPTEFINAHQRRSSTVGRREDGSYDYPIIDIYDRIGGSAQIGEPENNGGGIYVHRYCNTGWIQDFSGGAKGKAAVTRKDSQNRAYAIRGGIREKYFVLGGADSPLGWPVHTADNDCEIDTGIRTDAVFRGWCTSGRLTRFERGTIYYHCNGTYQGSGKAVYGAISDKYESMGGTHSILGFPITDEGQAYPSAVSGKQGRYNQFEGGIINHWDGKTYEVHGPVYSKYQELHFSSSRLGFPTSDVYQWSGRDRADFEGGYIYVNSSGLPVVVYNPTLPAQPSNLQAVVKSAYRVDLSWRDNSTNETCFKIETKRAQGTYTSYANTSANITSFTCNNLSPGTTYSFRVRAGNNDGTSNASNEVTVTTLPLPPAAPSNLSGYARSSGEIEITWCDNSDNETDFIIERKSGSSSFDLIAYCQMNTIVMRDTGLAPDTQYCYRVSAYNTGGVSGYSNEVLVRTLQITPDAPQAPFNLAACGVATDQIDLTWEECSSNENGFRIERALMDCSFIEIATVGENVTSFSDTGLASGAAYRYRVRSFNIGGDSGNSNEAYAVTLPLEIPDEPSNPDNPGGPSNPTDPGSPGSDSPSSPHPGSDGDVPGNSGAGVGGGCFIATAAYNSNQDSYLLVLRRFRDNVLMRHAPGRIFVAWYYRNSPPAAAVIAQNESLRSITRSLLTPLVFVIQFYREILMLVLAGLVFIRYRYRRMDSIGRMVKNLTRGESIV